MEAEGSSVASSCAQILRQCQWLQLIIFFSAPLMEAVVWR